MAAQYAIERRDRLEAMNSGLRLADHLDRTDPDRAAKVRAAVEADYALLSRSRQIGKAFKTYRGGGSIPEISAGNAAMIWEVSIDDRVTPLLDV